jgi:hypothetical protein
MSGDKVYRIRSPRFELLETRHASEMQDKVNAALDRGYEPWGALVVSATDEDARRFYQWVMGYQDEPAEKAAEGFVQVVSDVAPETAARVNSLIDTALNEGRELTAAERNQVQGLLGEICQPSSGPSELDLARAAHEPCVCDETPGDAPLCTVHHAGGRP